MILNKLLEENILQFSPSRRFGGHYENAYDDRYVVQNAAAKEGIIVSNDHFRDLIDEDEAFKEAIENRLLQFNFVSDKDGIFDIFMVPSDPRGKHGPKLEEFLMF
jgi:ribonuclease ZC3H12